MGVHARTVAILWLFLWCELANPVPIDIRQNATLPLLWKDVANMTLSNQQTVSLLQTGYWSFGQTMGSSTGPQESWPDGPLPGRNSDCVFFCDGTWWYDMLALILFALVSPTRPTILPPPTPPSPSRKPEIYIPPSKIPEPLPASPYNPPVVSASASPPPVEPPTPTPTPPPCECTAIQECENQGPGMWGWGDNAFGQLGHMERDDAFAPIEVEPMKTRKVLSFAIGWEHAIAVTECGEEIGKVVCRWGKHNFMRLGGQRCFQPGGEAQQLEDLMKSYGRQTDQVAAGRSHTFAIVQEEEGPVYYGWGNNNAGQLGTDMVERQDTGDRFIVPAWVTPVGPEFSHFIPQPIDGLDGLGEIKSLVAGSDHSAAVFADGMLMMWGRNNYGQCGTGTVMTIKVPTKIEGRWKQVALGYDFTVGLDSSGGVFVWGDNARYQLGEPNSYAFSEVPRPVGALEGVQMSGVGAGWYHGFAFGPSGVFSWGQNDAGQLGHNNKDMLIGPLDIDFFTTMAPTITEMCGGRSHSAAITSDGHIYTWGLNNVGQLGIQPPKDCAMGPMLVKDMEGKGATHIGCGYDNTFAW